MSEYGIRDEYEPVRGLQVLTLWSGSFFSTYEGRATALPGGGGFSVVTYNDDKVRISCPSPRDADNFRAVDKAINVAMEEHHRAAGRVQITEITGH